MDEPPAFCTLFILAVTAATTFQGFRNPRFTDRLIFEPSAILRDREVHRLLTSALLHADWVHFGFNAFSLFSFGRLIELVFGVPTLLAIYVGSIVGGDLLSLWLHRHHEYRALGASGGVCGIIFASIFLLPGGGIYMFPVPIAIPSWLYAILFIVGSFVALRRQQDNIGHDAHLGGALVGLLITAALYPASIRENLGLFAGVLGLALGGFMYLAIHPLYLPATAAPVPRRERPRASQRRRQQEDHSVEDRELDRLLDKVAAGGMQNLSAADLDRLQALSRRRQARK